MSKRNKNNKERRDTPSDPLLGLGGALALYRHRKGATRKDVGEYAGLKVNTIYKIENGDTTLGEKSLKKICDFLDVPVEDFYKVATSRFTDVQKRVFLILGQLEELGDTPGIEDAKVALGKSLPGESHH